MPDADDLALAYVRHVLAETGLAPTALAEGAKIASTTLTRPLNSKDHKFALSNSTVRKIEAFTGISYATFTATTEDTPHERTKGQPVRHVPSSEIVSLGGLKLPVYSGAQGGNGKLIVSSDIVDKVEMPAVLRDVSGAYGLLIDGESMQPEYWPGDIAWVHPHLRPARGRNHILFHTPPDGGDAEAIIKRVNGWSDREWDLEQWNPHKKFKEFRLEWPICHRVVGKYDAS